MCEVIRFPIEKCRPPEKPEGSAQVTRLMPPMTDERYCRLIEMVSERMDVEVVDMPCDVSGEVPFA